MHRVITRLLLAGLLLPFGVQAAPPRDMPILTIHPGPGGVSHVLSVADLEAYPSRSVTGLIPDVGDHEAEWTGVSLASLLQGLGEPLPARITASAMDSYRETIPISDLERYDPIVAYQRNGEYLSISQRGPLVIMYPYGEHPELLTRAFFSRTVWQLDELRLE
ncbi:molybdopterin-dependent oxidoreductase [Franzmannia qiaohouensis]|uniref:Molybdopterin-dependent oxidoreductase n=1 Tax=Franzmannia qiaohouensis TaxID=1329370 RepID=A0ABU1HG50_9GAMM|nr:molybdopterin-dependent oxidoreductase [Halomonas qiaohouensis]MDR5906455.1 molybdopterin-dependent oxidoreductase [Halomonas qiaohouensis]